MYSLSWRRWFTARLQELHQPNRPTSVTSLHLVECALCAQLTPGHVYLVAHTTVTVNVILLLPALVSGTVCFSGFDNQAFLLIVVKLH